MVFPLKGHRLQEAESYNGSGKESRRSDYKKRRDGLQSGLLFNRDDDMRMMRMKYVADNWHRDDQRDFL